MTAALAMRAPAPHISLVETQDDPVLAMLRRAKPMSPEMAERCRALNAEVGSDPSTWIPEETILAELAARRLAGK
jgi:hypothetical protein